MNHHVQSACACMRVCGLQLACRSLEASVCVELAAVDQERHQHDYYKKVIRGRVSMAHSS